jgi:ATP-dependent helicase/nuclease subunit A
MVERKVADQSERDAVVAERKRNVVVDAGAGTGKTTLIVRRLIEMVAPEKDAHPAVPLERIAAVTFTRKAAGELRLRIREGLLRALADPKLSATRQARLLSAVSMVDDARIGTIHSFADRLLRMYPVEARLSPSYEIVEDVAPLHAETFNLMMTAIERGTLDTELAGTAAEGRAEDASHAIQAALEAGVRIESHEHPYGIKYGIDALVGGLLDHRDVPPSDREAATFDRAAFMKNVDEFILRAKGSHGDGRGSRWLARSVRTLREVRDDSIVPRIYRRVAKVVGQGGKSFTKGVDFADDDVGYKAWKAFDGDKGKNPARATPLRDDLLGPLHGWMARQLVRLAPVAEVLYERVKTRRRVVDPIDLLLRLRNLLATSPAVRAELQSLFDHIFVDEFQDTDPLQAEVLLFLAEDGAKSKDAWDATLAQGRLTIVGDPKQSIYRFRRADVATYDRVRRKLGETKPLESTLSVNFRSTEGLVEWFNDRFAKILGEGKKGAHFDTGTGAMFHAPLEPAPDARTDAGARDIEVIPLGVDDENAPVAREREAEAIARYVRWLVAESATDVTDPVTGERRPLRYGDVAVLALVTTNLPLLCRAFDERRVPYATAGGTLFIGDPLSQQFLLGLRAVADREDGIAEAALLRPPFFAIDLADLAMLRDPEHAGSDPRALRAQAARDLVSELRKERAVRSPGATARDLLERTALGRMVALGPNGAQRLRLLRELCTELDAVAAESGLDFDGATYVMRRWVGAPPGIDAPRPVDDGAVRVSTVHQAKGLEFPVVILWDGRGGWDTRPFTPAWAIDRETRAWAINIDPGLAWDDPPGASFSERERKYRDEERKRLVYVAATRAREKLVIATSSGKDTCIHTLLAAKTAAGVEKRIQRWGVFDAKATDKWPRSSRARRESEAPSETEAAVTALDGQISAAWTGALGAAARPRFRRTAASALAKLGSTATGADDADAEDDEHEPPREVKRRPGRFGPVFGDTVHRALALALERKLDARAAVTRAAREVGLTANIEDAVGDVERTLDCLRRDCLLEGAFRLEYPIACDEIAGDDAGLLVVGSIDLLSADSGRLDVIDFKSDRAPEEGARVADTHPAYAVQVRAYGRMLEKTGVAAGKDVRRGLLFTEKGRIWWV